MSDLEYIGEGVEDQIESPIEVEEPKEPKSD